MITIDEAKQYNWVVQYKILEDTTLNTIIDAKYYDFIPSKDDIIVVEDKTYIVLFVMYDFDLSTIIINLKEIIQK